MIRKYFLCGGRSQDNKVTVVLVKATDKHEAIVQAQEHFTDSELIYCIEAQSGNKILAKITL